MFRHYLLGIIIDDVTQARIEKRLMTDDEFAAEVSSAENDLIEDYLDGGLTPDETDRFTSYFLASSGRKRQLRLIQNLRRFSARVETSSPHPERNFFDWIPRLSLRLRFAALIVGVLGLGLLVWRFGVYQSDADKGLAQLRTAHQGQRPIESRLSAFPDYSPFAETRGARTASGDPAARDRAERYLLDATRDSADAKSHHALALFYLSGKKYDRAIREFDVALSESPNDALLQSDIGAANLEMARDADDEKNGARYLELLNSSLKHLDRAIALDPKLPEPRFNRALCLQALRAQDQAKQAWREYLELDKSSPWADEARRNLEILESRGVREQTAAELESEFVAVFNQQQREQATRLLSKNRELIRGKYLPQRLAMSYLEAPAADNTVYLRALTYTGEIELENTGDPFAGELAGFYANLSGDKIDLLKEAQNAVRAGYKSCLSLDYGAALIEFKRARELFVRAGDKWEAKLSEYFIGYCLFNTDRVNESVDQLGRVTEFARGGRYRWLETTALYWLGNSYESSGQSTLSRKTYERALAIAEEIDDPFARQRCLMALANRGAAVRQINYALGFLSRALKASGDGEIGPRQKYRNYFDASQILIEARLPHAAKAIAVEAVGLADRLDDRMFQALSRNNAGLAYTLVGDFGEARSWIDSGRERAEGIAAESSRNRMTAYSFLATGYLEREEGNFDKSEGSYDAAAKLYETMQMPSNLYIAQKGKLLAYRALGKSEDMARQIPLTLKLNEDYREAIYEERERTSYFDSQETIYDIAVDYELGRGEAERAYDYAEISSARSLLDRLKTGARVKDDNQNLEILINENATPLGLAAIREKMPDGIQIIQYSVLDDKLLIWLVSRDKFIVGRTKIPSDELRDKVEEYVYLLTLNDEASGETVDRLSSQLFQLLLEPVMDQLDPALKICLVPNKFLFTLPFATLRSAAGEPLLKNFDIVYAPSANTFLACTENARLKAASPSEALLSIGNPAFDRREFEDLADLPGAENEAREIAAFYEQSEIYLGAKATRSIILHQIKKANVVHFAGHYVVVPDDPLSSYLLLASGSFSKDSKLTNSNLVAEQLPMAKLIVLSACQTGIESYGEGEGLTGLSRTFVAAGAPLVVASQWKVDTAATEYLMKRFHFYRRQGKMPTSEALRRAQLEMANDPSGHFRNPYYWAGFAVFGGYARF